MSKISATQILVVNPTPLDDDEADFLMSRERERIGSGFPFEEFLKRHPDDVKSFVKRKGKQPGPNWKIQLLGGTEKEYDGLREGVRAAALGVLHDLAQDPSPKGSSAVSGHRGYHRTTFYRDQYRLIYTVSKTRHEIAVTRIRRKDEKTYVGHEQSGEIQ